MPHFEVLNALETKLAKQHGTGPGGVGGGGGTLSPGEKACSCSYCQGHSGTFSASSIG